ncbi:MAG TPA: sigma-70 family RNA polymerase sigma factor [Ktedonobacteraceae bacterium]|nr:sigma-70 family RNA polymerase sigma factor [Ktedonobacteraceae bacterium]
MQSTNAQADSDAGMLDVELYDRFAPAILSALLQQVAHPQDAEDLLLEVFMAALQSSVLEQLPPERQLAWLRRVARNKVIDRYRHHALVTLLPLEQAHTQEDQALTPEQHAEHQEKLDWLAHALVQLSSSQQELLRLRYSHELRLAEIAAIVGRSEGAVRKQLARTIRQLQKLYTRLEKEDQL